MMELDPSYLAAIATQLATMSSVLGGFAITFFVTLLVLTETSRAARVAIGLSSIASMLFIGAVGASADIIINTHPAAPAAAASKNLDWSRYVALLSFTGGIVSLGGAIGASGWMRSRFIGGVTTASAVLGLFLFISALMVSR